VFNHIKEILQYSPDGVLGDIIYRGIIPVNRDVGSNNKIS